MNGPVAAALDGEVEIVPPGVLKRSMMSMARHPDGAVYLNTQTGPLYRSADRGRSWTPVPVEMPDLAHPQVLHGIGIGGDGRLWLSHSSDREHPGGLYGQDLHVSHSADGGVTWQRSATDFGAIPPGIPNLCFHEDGNRTFVELPDGTLMFSTTVVPAPPYADSFPSASGEAYGGRPGDLFGDLILRSSDRGRTWGDATRVDPFLNPHESNLAVDPRDGGARPADGALPAGLRPQRGPGRVHGEDGESRAGDQAGRPVRIDRRRPHLRGGRGGPTGMDTAGMFISLPAVPS